MTNEDVMARSDCGRHAPEESPASCCWFAAPVVDVAAAAMAATVYTYLRLRLIQKQQTTTTAQLSLLGSLRVLRTSHLAAFFKKK